MIEIWRKGLIHNFGSKPRKQPVLETKIGKLQQDKSVYEGVVRLDGYD